MHKNMVASNIAVYSASHGLVDAACAAVLFAIGAAGLAEPQVFLQFIVIYNILAFSTQPIFGLVADTYQLSTHSAVLGILLVAASTLLLPVPLLAVLSAAIGNALFHIGGGIASLNLASGKAALPGIFVAPGALGLMIGILIGKSGAFLAWPFLLLLLVSALLILLVPRPEAVPLRTLPKSLRWFEAVILLLLISIAIRSLVGLSLVFPWKSDPGLLLGLTLAVVLGKALGGILGDRFGWTAVGVSGLIASLPLLVFFPQLPALAILGIFLFNLSMPITLVCLAQMLPGKNGFAFGLTTLALIVGALPTFTQLRILTGQQASVLAAILISTVALYIALQLYTGHFSDRISEQPSRLPHEEKEYRRML